MVYFKDFLNLDKERGLVRYDHLDLDMSLEILDPHTSRVRRTLVLLYESYKERIGWGEGGGTT